MLKADLRKIYKAKRKSFNAQEFQQMNAQIAKNATQFICDEYSVYHVFLPIQRMFEVNTYPIIDQLFKAGKRVVLSKVEGDKMLNCEVNSDFKTELNSLQIPEPTAYTEINSQEIDVVFIPLLISDKKGNRVGFGAGFYDRFLKSCKTNVVKIGLNYFESIDEISDVYEFDVRLDYCVNPYRIESFSETL